MTEEIQFDGRPVAMESGQTVAGALWRAGIRTWRRTRREGQARGLFCGIGACYDCLATIDGRPDQRSCVTPATPGMVVLSGLVADGPGHAPAAGEGRADAVAREHRVAEPGGRAVAQRALARRYDVAVIGAGPAGLAAAAAAALAGCQVVLVDSASRPGGQFWRHRAGEDGQHGYRDWSIFQGLLSIVEERVDYLPDRTVWFVEPGFTLHTSQGRVEAARLVLATGAYDRALPFPGWQLPGVVTPGAAQALLKGSGVAIGREVVVAGAGPFLLPVAVGLAEAGVRVVGVFDAGDARRYLRQPRAVGGVVGRLGEAAVYAATLARRRIPYRMRHAVVAAHGDDGSVTAVDIGRLDQHGQLISGSVRRVRCDAVAVGYGFTANLDLALLLDCATRVSVDGGLALTVDANGETSVPGVFAAGELTGVGGASLATVEGQLAGMAAAASVSGSAKPSGREVASLRRRISRLKTFADLMHTTHPVPAGWPRWTDDQTLVCRCEEVSCGEVAAAVNDLGATDARTVKLLVRPAMGWCQGRVCGFATARLVAWQLGRPVTSADLVGLAVRPLAAPILMGDLANPDRS